MLFPSSEAMLQTAIYSGVNRVNGAREAEAMKCPLLPKSSRIDLTPSVQFSVKYATIVHTVL